MLLAFADHASLALSDSPQDPGDAGGGRRAHQARFRSLVKSSSDMITRDRPGRASSIYASPSVERTLDLPPCGSGGRPARAR